MSIDAMLAPELCSFCGGSLTTWAGEHRSARVRTRAQTKGTRGLVLENVPSGLVQTTKTRTRTLGFDELRKAFPAALARRRAAPTAFLRHICDGRGLPARPGMDDADDKEREGLLMRASRS